MVGRQLCPALTPVAASQHKQTNKQTNNDVMLGRQTIMSSTDHRQWNSIHWYEDKTHKLGDFKYAVYGYCSEANWELCFQREDFG